MSEQIFYGHGKLLISGEYVVLEGAKALAMPTKQGQNLKVKYRPSRNPKLFWKSYDHLGHCWLELEFELWHFNIISPESPCETGNLLSQILRQARKQNIHFLRDEQDVFVETHLEFSREWGLGSSSTLIYNIAQWAYISPFELLSKTFGGSGYDIACAQSLGPITYEIKSAGPSWETAKFNAVFKENIYFVYLNRKQNSRDEIKSYKEINLEQRKTCAQKISLLTEKMIKAIDLKEFEEYLFEHENLMANLLGSIRVQDKYFSDFWGAVKSLGAWGGDFALVTSAKSFEETKEYFHKKGFKTLISFDDMILQQFQTYSRDVSSEFEKEKTYA